MTPVNHSIAFIAQDLNNWINVSLGDLGQFNNLGF